MDAAAVIEEKYRALANRLDEATLRLWAAVEARTLGRGGVSAVAKACGLSRTTIYAGLRELDAPTPRGEVAAGSPGRIRAKGGGRKKLTDKDRTLLSDLDALVEPTARGDPQSPLRWTCKSTPRLAKELAERGHAVSQRSVCDLLAQLDYSLQATRKTREGGKQPDRDAQFGYIAALAAQ
jgi:transposase